MRLGKGQASPNGIPIDVLSVTYLIASKGLAGVSEILRSDQNDEAR